MADGRCITMTVNSRDPFIIFTKTPRTHKIHEPKIPKIYPVFPPVLETTIRDVLYRLATKNDLKLICKFTDFWLSGKGYAAHIPGAGTDCFIPYGQHLGYLERYTVVLAFHHDVLCGWAVRQRDGTLIHLLVSAESRGLGIGATFLDILKPPAIRSKSDQSTGDPLPFYVQHGYAKTTDQRTGKNQNIDVLVRR